MHFIPSRDSKALQNYTLGPKRDAKSFKSNQSENERHEKLQNKPFSPLQLKRVCLKTMCVEVHSTVLFSERRCVYDMGIEGRPQSQCTDADDDDKITRLVLSGQVRSVKVERKGKDNAYFPFCGFGQSVKIQINTHIKLHWSLLGLSSL